MDSRQVVATIARELGLRPGQVTAAAEVAFALARPGKKCVFILNVIERDEGAYDYREAASAEHRARQHARAQEIVSGIAELGRLYDLEADTLVEAGRNPDETILEVAERENADLIVLGTDLRPGSSRLFLGPRVENVLIHARCPVVVMNSD